MLRLDNAKNDVCLDKIAYFGRKVLYASFFERSVQVVKAFGASFKLGAENGYRMYVGSRYASRYEKGEYDVYYSKCTAMKDVYWHGMIVSKDIGKNLFVGTASELGRITYEYLMKNGKWPLLPEWGDAIFQSGCSYYCCRKTRVYVDYGKNSYSAAADREASEKHRAEGEDTVLYAVEFYDNFVDTLPLILKSLIGHQVISLGNPNQPPMSFTDIDTYFEKYGTCLVSNLEKEMKPLTELSGDIENCALMTMRMYPQQIAMINGCVKLLSGKKQSGSSNYAIINGGMGVGKTNIALSIVEKYYVDKWLRQHPDKEWKDAYRTADTIRYRVIISGPGHLVEKWCKEAREQIPFATVIPLTDFKQLLKLRDRGPKPEGREIWVISKDFAKLSYATRPVPVIRKKGEVRAKYCEFCGERFVTPGLTCPKCHHKGYTFKDEYGALNDSDVIYRTVGLSCPACGRIVIPYRGITTVQGEIEGESLDYPDFENPRSDNLKCFWCEEPLWQPNVKPLDLAWWSEGQKERPKPKWKRISIFANAKCSSTKSIWVMPKYDKRTGSALSERKDLSGVRKYSPALYIKKHLSGYFDMYIADEFHEYKATSGQGEAFAALSAAAKKTIAMTGTLTGGKAEDLYFSFFRLDPTRMRAAGFDYGDVMKFSYKYGNIRTTTMYGESTEEDTEFSISTKGRNRRSSRKVEPGISPVLFTDFLLDRTLYLDLSDMTCHLPPLKETVVTVGFKGEEEIAMKDDYDFVIDVLTKKAKKDKGEYGLMGTMLQFSQSFLDKPWTVEEKTIRSPLTGDIVCEIPQFDSFKRVEHLSSKEQALCRNVKAELEKGRNCFVYATYSGKEDTNVTPRLKAILERETGEKVEILKAESPAPSERERYIHKLAKSGVRVVITNPKCVETGLDFVWWEDGVEYNFPSIHCYQLNFELACIQQAIHRHLRLIQPRECTTFFYCWEGTAQAELLKILAKKMSAAQAIQGHFSAEGLLAMAEGVDARLELAKALAEKDRTSGADLQSMFDVMEADRSAQDDAGKWKPMLTLKEVIGEQEYGRHFNVAEDDDDEAIDLGETGDDEIDLTAAFDFIGF